jgi:hypothetical protein
MKSENHETCGCVLLLHVEAVVKKFKKFLASCDVGCLKPRQLARNFLITCVEMSGV